MEQNRTNINQNFRKYCIQSCFRCVTRKTLTFGLLQCVSNRNYIFIQVEKENRINYSFRKGPVPQQGSKGWHEYPQATAAARKPIVYFLTWLWATAREFETNRTIVQNITSWNECYPRYILKFFICVALFISKIIRMTEYQLHESHM